MEENGNKGDSRLAFIFLVIITLITAACIILSSSGFFSDRPIYRDPELSLSLVRGSILDRNGGYLAIQAPDFGFEIHINDSSPAEAAHFISQWSDENAISIEEKISRGEKFIPITIIPSSIEREEIIRRLTEMNLSDDITPNSIEKRKYPLGQHAVNIVGITNRWLDGVSGLERLYNKPLSPIPSIYSVIATGKDLHTTIEPMLQYRLSDEDARAAILSPEKEILAYTGYADDTILSAICGDTDAEEALKASSLKPLEIDNGYILYTEDASILPFVISILEEEGFVSTQVIPEP